MQTLLKENTLVYREDNLTGTENESIRHYLSELQKADNKTKSEIENKLVNIGSKAVPELVSQLQVLKGTVRGVVAMTLIRIGEESIEHLQKAASVNKDFEWVASYLINEITLSNAA